jgi:small subunit ribosomal protein S16
MLRIRLRRVGKKGRPSYRIVVADSRAPRDGAYVEWIGHYDPLYDPPKVTLNEEKAVEWLRKGAQPSEPVQRIFGWQGIFEKVKGNEGAN